MIMMIINHHHDFIEIVVYSAIALIETHSMSYEFDDRLSKTYTQISESERIKLNSFFLLNLAPAKQE